MIALATQTNRHPCPRAGVQLVSRAVPKGSWAPDQVRGEVELNLDQMSEAQ